MRAVLQRVGRARVTVEQRVVAEIAAGLMILLGVGTADTAATATSMAEKIAELRIFADDAGLMNRSLRQTGGALLLVSQFTLHGDVRRGRRPSFIAAASPEPARRLFERVGTAVAQMGLRVAYGEFGAQMAVELINDGPVTILIDTKRVF